MTRICLLLLTLLLSPIPGQAGKYVYEYTGNCSRAYLDYMSLHMTDGQTAIITEVTTNPYNLMATYISDYDDYLVLLLNCNRADYEQRKENLDRRLDLLDNGNPASPWHRLCKAGIYLHWAIIHLRFGEQYKAVNYFRKSFALLKENQQLYPSFEYNKVFAGLQEAVIGSLPGNYKWIASVFGMKGNMRQGIDKLGSFINTHSEKDPLYAETVLYYSYTRFYLLLEQKEVWSFLNSLQFPTRDNLLNVFAKVTIGLDYRKSDAVMETLSAAARETNYDQYPIFDHQMGVALLSKLDTGCIGYFQRYLKKNKSDLFIKDSWLKMAYMHYIKGSATQVKQCMNNVKTQGYARGDADKQALKYAEKDVWPANKILQARLLTDGGYYNMALVLLRNLDPAKLPREADRLEYSYRMGKAYQELGDYNKALDSYQATINAGKTLHEQFAARAALQMGIIYERTGMKEQALKRYKECLAMPEHDFQNSIDQQAKAGILRVEGK